MPWELTGNPDADIGPNNFLGTIGPNDPLRIKTSQADDVNLPNWPTGKDVMFITDSNPDVFPNGELGIVGIRTNIPQGALEVLGRRGMPTIICGPRPGESGGGPGLLLKGGVWRGVELDVPFPRVPVVNPTPGELVLGGIRTSIRGFDGGPDEPNRPDTSPIRLGNHFIRTNGNESELWMAFSRGRTVSPVSGQLFRQLIAAVRWVGPSFDKPVPATPLDARLKTNVSQLEGTLERLERIRGVAFEWAEAESPFALGGVPGQLSLGVVAQEVEEVFPEVVSIYDAEQEYRAVDYNGLTCVLIEAVKELKAQNEALRSRVEALERAQE
jgi:Chaperone of endosialidase